MDIRTAQELAWLNKRIRGMNLTDIGLEFGLLIGEVSEAMTAWRRGHAELGAELADIVIYVVALAEMNGLDLDAEVTTKLAINASRVYQRDERGVLVRVEKGS